MPTIIGQLAFGSLAKDSDGKFRARLIGVPSLDRVPERIRQYLTAHISSIFSRSEDHGQALPGWWVQAGPPAEISALSASSGANFRDSSAVALQKLEAVTPGSASPGLVVMIQLTNDGSNYLSILKLDMDERDLYRFVEAANVNDVIQYQHLDDVLPPTGDLKKAALIPNPTATSDLRVVDEQDSAGAADYWLKFLGAKVIPPPQKTAKVLIEATKLALAGQVSSAALSTAVGRALTQLTGQTGQTSRDQFVGNVADAAGVNRDTTIQRVGELTRARIPEQATMSGRALERVDLVITFRVGGQTVTIKGPAEALEGKYQVRRQGNGYVVQVSADSEPTTDIQVRPGRVSVN